MEQIISLKTHNYDYAPGFATYALDGQQGVQGINGNNIYYTNFSIMNGDLSQLQIAIKSNLVPIKNSSEHIQRDYQNNDIFFDNNGVIWQLYDYNSFINDRTLKEYSQYFKIVGQIKLDENTYFKQSQDGKLIIDSSNYKGFDIVTGNANASNYLNKDMPMNIVSSNIDDNGQIQFIQFKSLDSANIDNGYLQLYYNVNDNTFHIKSDDVIVVDTDVKISKQSDVVNTDGYSSVLPVDDTITYFCNLCSKICYTTHSEVSTGKKYVVIEAKDQTLPYDKQLAILDKFVSYEDVVYAKIVDSDMNQCIRPLENIKDKIEIIPLICQQDTTYGDYPDTVSNLTAGIAPISTNFGQTDWSNVTTMQSVNASVTVVDDEEHNKILELTRKSRSNIKLSDFVVKFEVVFPTDTSNSTYDYFWKDCTTQTIFDNTIEGKFTFTTPKQSVVNFRIRASIISRFANNSDPIYIFNIADESMLDFDTTYRLSYDFKTDDDNLLLNIYELCENKNGYCIYNVNIPVISVELPAAMNNVEIVSIMHNSEVIIQERK